MSLTMLNSELHSLRTSILQKLRILSDTVISASHRESLNMDLHEQYVQCAECACRLLCEEISASLPLELREMIYEQILRSQPPPHCWSAAYLGDECFEEFMSTYHRINTFKFIVGHPIQSLLRPDSPVELSRLQSVGPINVDFSFSARLAAYSTLYPKHIETEFPYLTTLVANLRELATFKTGMRITINIDDVTVWAFHMVDLPDNPNFKTLANTSDDDIRKLLFNLNADLFPEFETLKEAGHRLTFFVKTRWAKLRLPGDMALSMEAWFPKLKIFQNFVRDRATPEECILYRTNGSDDSD